MLSTGRTQRVANPNMGLILLVLVEVNRTITINRQRHQSPDLLWTGMVGCAFRP